MRELLLSLSPLHVPVYVQMEKKVVLKMDKKGG